VPSPKEKGGAKLPAGGRARGEGGDGSWWTQKERRREEGALEQVYPRLPRKEDDPNEKTLGEAGRGKDSVLDPHSP